MSPRAMRYALLFSLLLWLAVGFVVMAALFAAGSVDGATKEYQIIQQTKEY